MRCPRCTQDNPSDARYCRVCGEQIGVPCPGCAQLNLPDSRFCSGCGKALTTPLPTARFASPDSYTPEHLADQILASRAALEGERKQVTILFADLKSSMELLAHRDPEEAQQILDPVLERMMEAVHHYEGTVNQVMGDGIMALFGAPIAHEDHAVRACFAALRMQGAIEEYAAGLRSTRGIDVQIRIGLNSGEVVVRSIGNDLHMDYSAVGQSTHLAARLEQLARPGVILISAQTLRRAEGYVEVKSLGLVPLKGVAEPLEVFELTKARALSSRLEAALSRGLSPFVGRETEMAEMDRALERARSGHGQIVGVAGEPGVGKSRLLWEFLHASRHDGWRVLETHALPYEQGTPYFPIIRLLKACFAVAEGQRPDAVREQVLAQLGPDASSRFLSPLLALLDVAVADPRWHSLTPDQRRRRTLDAIRHLFVQLSQSQPLCIAVEDLHWIDSETQAVLDSLAEGLGTARLALLVSYRPEYAHSWTTKAHYTEIRVNPLKSAGVESLLRALVGDSSDLEPLKALLVARTEGNPFFLEESVRNLAETRALAGAPGAYRLVQPPQGLQVPDTIQTVLAARIDRLSPDDKRLLETASAIGRDVPRRLLEAVGEVSGDALSGGLARLRVGGFLYETRLTPEIEYTFKHALTHEVVYGTPLRPRRRALDVRIVEALERLDPDGAVDRLAHHALRGELWEKALLYCRKAGGRAFAHSAHRAAVKHFENALAALEHLVESPETTAQAIDLRVDLRYALSPLGEYRKMLEVMTAAERLATASGDQGRLGLVSAHLSNFFTLKGDLSQALEYGQRAVEVVKTVRDLKVSVVANSNLGMAYFAAGQYRKAIEAASPNLDALEGDVKFQHLGMAQLPIVYSRTVMAWSLAEIGDFETGIQIGQEGVRIAEQADHTHSIIFACLGLGTVYLRKGDLSEAIALLERALDLWRGADLPAILLEVAGPLASAYAQSGRTGDAIALLEQAVAQAVALRHRYGHWLRTGSLAEAYLAAGRIDEALPLAQIFVELTRAVRARGWEAWALYLLGEAYARSAPPDKGKATETLGGALTLAAELGMRPLQGHCHFSLGALNCQNSAQADRLSLETAADIFTKVGMRSWHARTHAELAKLH